MFVLFDGITHHIHASTRFNAITLDPDNSPALDTSTENELQYILSLVKNKNRNIETVKLPSLIQFVTKKNVPSGGVSLKERHGKGAFARQTVQAPFDKVVAYYFSNDVPSEIIQPAGLRTSKKIQSDTIQQDVITLFLNGRLASPALYFEEKEETTTPDIFSGAYYTYPVRYAKALLPTKKADPRIAIIANLQQKTSSIAKKAVIYGDEENWNYVYSNLYGGTSASVGWVKSCVYDSAMVLVLVENGSTTELFLFKWLRAGWLRINVATSSHIYRGSVRVLASIAKVFSSPTLPSIQDIATQHATLSQLSDNALTKKLFEYSKKLSDISKTIEPLATSPWQKFIANNGYATSLTRQEKISLLMKNYLKNVIGVPVL